MFRRSSNNVFIPPKGLNGGSFAKIGNSTDELGERYPGLLGATLVVDDAGALKYSDTTVGTLYNGVYQLVKLTSNIVKGQLVFWDTLANNGIDEFEVTGTATENTLFRAGVAICDGTSGEYCWIQVAGLATCKYAASTQTSAGRLVLQSANNAGTVTAVADNAAFATAAVVLLQVGIAYEAPTVNGLKQVILNLGAFYPNIA